MDKNITLTFTRNGRGKAPEGLQSALVVKYLAPASDRETPVENYFLYRRRQTGLNGLPGSGPSAHAGGSQG
jgi:hypothetical protein